MTTQEEVEKVEITPVINDKEQRKKDIFKSWKLLVGVIASLAIIVAVVYKVQNPDFSYKTLFIVIGSSIIFFAVVFYFFKLKSKIEILLKEKKEEILLPKPVSREILLEKLHKEAFTNAEYFNHVEEVIDSWPEMINGNEIRCFWVKVVYADFPGDSCERFVIYNANYIDRLPAIRGRSISTSGIDITANEIRRTMNRMAENPIESDVIRKFERNPLLGTEAETIMKSHHKKEEKDKHKKSDEFTEE